MLWLVCVARISLWPPSGSLVFVISVGRIQVRHALLKIGRVYLMVTWAFLTERRVAKKTVLVYILGRLYTISKLLEKTASPEGRFSIQVIGKPI